MREYFEGVKAEWKKIIWPSKKELKSKTGSVVLSAILLGVFAVILDYIFQNGVNLISGLF